MTGKRERFCQEFIVDLNATQAAIRSGYSEKTARSQGHRLLTDADIKARIQELKDERAERLKITQGEVLQFWVEIKRLDPRNYMNIDELTGAIKAKGFNSQPIGASQFIKEVKEKRVIKGSATGDGDEVILDSTLEYKFPDKLKATEMIARHLGMFEKDQQDPEKESNTLESIADALMNRYKNDKQ